MKRFFTRVGFYVAAVLFFSCAPSSKKAVSGFGEYLALRDELTSPEEAVVWTLAADGDVSTYWIKNDVTGIVIVAKREDWVLPNESGMWRLENDDPEEETEFLAFRNLLDDERMLIPFDENDDFSDGGDADAGESEKCPSTIVRGRPFPLISIGSYVFLKYEEKILDCRDNLMLSEERYMTVDLSTGEQVDILSDDERDVLFMRKDVRALESEGSVRLEGTVPAYSPSFALTFVHVFSALHREDSESDDGFRVVNTLEISDMHLPEKLKQYYLPPDIVRAFGTSLPDVVLGGFAVLGGPPEQLLRRFVAFTESGSSAQPSEIK